MTRLAIEKMSVDAIPPGSGVEAGVKFLSSKENIANGWQQASAWAKDAVVAVRAAAEPNPWKNSTDEEIASELLRLAELRKRVYV